MPGVARLRLALGSVWDDPDIEQIRVEDLAGDHPVVRYGPPGEDFVIDLLGRIGEVFRYEDLEVETIDLDGVRARVATPRTLYRRKRGTLRPQDRADAAVLRERFALGED